MTSATTEPAQTELKEDLHPPSGIEGVDGSDVDAAAGLEPAERVASELLLAHNQASTSAAGVLNSDLTGQAVLNLRPVRPRQTFSEEQVAAMEAMFERKQYLAPPERQALADLVKLTPQQVRVWFQNRRQKIKQYLCLRQGREQRGSQESNDNSVVITPDFLKTLDTNSLQLVMAQAQAAAAAAATNSSSLSTAPAATATTTCVSSPHSTSATSVSSSSLSVSSSSSPSLPVSTSKETASGDAIVNKGVQAAVSSPQLLIQQQPSAGGVLLLTQPPAGAKLGDNSVPLQAVPANISSVLTAAAATSSAQAGSSPAPSVVCIAPMLLPALLNGIQLQQGAGSIGAAPALQLSNGAQLLTLLGQGPAPASSLSIAGSVAAPATVLATTTAAAASPQLVLPVQLDAQSLGTTPVLSLPSPAKGSGLDLLKLAQISQLDKSVATLSDSGDGGGDKVKDTPLDSNASIAGSDALKQLLDQTTDGVKCTWNLNVKPTATITTLSPVVSGSLVNGTLSPATAQGSSPLAQSAFGRRKRSVFSGFQVEELEKHFQVCSYINAAERERLASKIGLTADQVKVWFQNRRTKKTRTSWRSKEE